jgi:hypothetical protein
MKKTLTMMLLCPVLLMAQSKAEWTFYGPAFGYEKEKFLENGFATTGILDLLFTSDGAMVISTLDAPIFFFKDGKDYNTARMVFTKEGRSSL